MKVFVLFEPGHYVDEPGIVWGVFSTKEEAQKYVDNKSYRYMVIDEYTIDKYGTSED
ncbi:DUF7336 domain-containing protein [Paenilisteria rocourtiae]|uniref:DUF7336 domain-containing protein n=1 Tax=Listeria rocourtiae TaxID=647910 RepID=A0A4R6ZNV3_9LIST|nr:hypothetical protein [Listeria rocourtiae]TDR54200.1 hypothetical protein DFP96_103300 [Listeria rocourtiae]